MNLSEQPGRVLAIFLFSPLILCKGIKYDDKFLIQRKSFGENSFLKLSIGKKKHLKINLT